MNSMHDLFANWPENQPHVKPTPADLAERFMEEHDFKTKEGLKLVHWGGDYYLFENTHFNLFSSADIRAKVVSWMQKNLELRNYSKTSSVNNVILNVEAIAKIRDQIHNPSWINSKNGLPSNCINLNNGIFDLDKFLKREAELLRPHSCKFFSTIHLPYCYDPSARCPRWLAFKKCNLMNP